MLARSGGAGGFACVNQPIGGPQTNAASGRVSARSGSIAHPGGIGTRGYEPRCAGGFACVLLAAFCRNAVAFSNGYVEPGLCRECHSEIADVYAQTGMARTYSAVVGPVAEGTFFHEPSAERFSIRRRGNQSILRREQTGWDGKPANMLEKRMEYQFGSGNHARSYFGRDANGNLIELPLTWYAGSGWNMGPGYDSARHAGFSRKVNDRCLFCHNAYSALPVGVDCQRCHGPGGDHIAAAREHRGAAEVRNSIVNPAKLDAQRNLEICLQCHLETSSVALPAGLPVYGRDPFSYRAGEPLGEFMMYFDREGGNKDERFEFVSAPYRLFQSACYRASAGALTCTRCHDPHLPSPPRAHFTTVCRNCHGEKLSPGHPSGDDCVECHMPKRQPSDAIHTSVTDHFIRRRPAVPAREAAAAGNTASQPYRGRVVPYYPPDVPDLYRAVAQVKNQANLGEGVPALEAAVKQSKPEQAEVYVDLADAQRHSGDSVKAAATYREALRRDPKQWRARYGLGLALEATGDPGGALAALGAAQELSPEEPVIYQAIAGVLERQGKAPEAIAALEEGLSQIPDSSDLHNSLGTALLRAGQASAAEPGFREAIRLRPEIPGIHVNLATLLAGRPDFAEARFEFETAIHLDPASAENHSAYATSLAARKLWPEARAQFETALRLNPQLPNAHNNLGTVLRESGDLAGATQEFRAAIGIDGRFSIAHYNLGEALAASGRPGDAEREMELALAADPGYFAAHLRLAQLLLARGERKTALPHLATAASSPDEGLAAIARNLLNSNR